MRTWIADGTAEMSRKQCPQFLIPGPNAACSSRISAAKIIMRKTGPVETVPHRFVRRIPVSGTMAG